MKKKIKITRVSISSRWKPSVALWTRQKSQATSCDKKIPHTGDTNSLDRCGQQNWCEGNWRLEKEILYNFLLMIVLFICRFQQCTEASENKLIAICARNRKKLFFQYKMFRVVPQLGGDSCRNGNTRDAGTFYLK